MSNKEKPINYLKFLTAEKNAIETSKYIESQKAHRDLYFDENNKPTQDFYIWWIETFAEDFRAAWTSSLCKKCAKVPYCKNCLKNKCENFLSE